MSTRIDRISEEVMKALAEAMRSVKDPRVQEAMVSVVHCDVTTICFMRSAIFPYSAASSRPGT